MEERPKHISEVEDAYETCADELVRFAATLVGPDHAHDVVSTAVVGVLQHTGTVQDMVPYLYRAVSNSAAKHWRSLNRRERREALVHSDRTATATQNQGDVDMDVRASLLQLSPQQRAVIHLTYWEDLTPGVVANRLGISDGSVRRQLARARKKLKDVLR